jgi:hypothetical protein
VDAVAFGRDSQSLLEARSYCFYGLGSIIGAVHPDGPGRVAACTRFALPADRSDCLSGARSAG